MKSITLRSSLMIAEKNISVSVRIMPVAASSSKAGKRFSVDHDGVDDRAIAATGHRSCRPAPAGSWVFEHPLDLICAGWSRRVPCRASIEQYAVRRTAPQESTTAAKPIRTHSRGCSGGFGSFGRADRSLHAKKELRRNQHCLDRESHSRARSCHRSCWARRNQCLSKSSELLCRSPLAGTRARQTRRRIDTGRLIGRRQVLRRS